MLKLSITWVIENGHPHYKIVNNSTKKEIYCNEGELNKIIQRLMEK